MIALDTYALIEITKVNKKFTELLDSDFVISDITMVEFYSIIYKEHNKKTADYWYKKFSSFCESVSIDILLSATRFRIDNAKKGFSFFDCVGYIFALEKNLNS